MKQFGNSNMDASVCLDYENIIQWHWPNSKLNFKITVSINIDNDKYGWSCPLNIDQVQRKDILLRNSSSDRSIIIN